MKSFLFTEVSECKLRQKGEGLLDIFTINLTPSIGPLTFIKAFISHIIVKNLTFKFT